MTSSVQLKNTQRWQHKVDDEFWTTQKLISVLPHQHSLTPVFTLTCRKTGNSFFQTTSVAISNPNPNPNPQKGKEKEKKKKRKKERKKEKRKKGHHRTPQQYQNANQPANTHLYL